MKEYNLILSRKAKTDIIDIGDYIAYTLPEPETAYHFEELHRLGRALIR